MTTITINIELEDNGELIGVTCCGGKIPARQVGNGPVFWEAHDTGKVVYMLFEAPKQQ